MKRPRGSEDDGLDDIPESSRVRDVQHRSDGSMDDPILECKHRIFLSHSGYQKDFVEILCEDLENFGRFPFFDKRPSSLPKGESFPELILTAARQCQMGVVVVSEEYFMSKWPMIELDAFVQTWLTQKEQQSETKLKILPLFYELSLVEFEKEERRAAWYSKWEDLAKEDEQINMSSWKNSLRQLKRFNGIEYYPRTTGLKAYRQEIVKHICNEVSADVKWDDSHVQGGSKLCQVIEDAISCVQPSEQYGVRVVGVYGVGGMGKTTLCKILCNKLFEKSDVKSSHVELGSKSYGKLLKKVLKDLTNRDQVFVKGLDEGECWNLLRDACKQKIFLAIDNVWPDSKSLEEAKKYLKLGKGSLQEIGNRVQRLKERGLVEDVDMGAQKVYMHDLYREFAKLEASGKLKDLDFKKRKWAYYVDSYPTELLEMMPSRVRWQNLARVGVVAVLYWRESFSLEGIEWKSLSNVVVLKLICNSVGAHIRDLDFKHLTCLKSLELVRYYPRNTLDGLQDLIHLVYFKWNCSKESSEVFLGKLPASLKVLLLKGDKVSLVSGAFDLCSNLANLEMRDCGAGNLDFRNCSSLQRLRLLGLHHLDSELSLDGLQDLSKLTVFRWKHLDDGYAELEGEFYHRLQCQLPASLQVLEIVENVSLRSDVFARCTELSKLILRFCRAESLNMRNCKALHCVELEIVERLRTLSGLSSSAATLETLTVNGCYNLDRIPGLDQLVGLERLHLRNLCVFRNLRLSDLSCLTHLVELQLDGTDVELREEDVCVLASLPRLTPVDVGKDSRFSVDVKRRKVLKTDWGYEKQWEERDQGENQCNLNNRIHQKFDSKTKGQVEKKTNTRISQKRKKKSTRE